jgi:flagellar assembly factor FliW
MFGKKKKKAVRMKNETNLKLKPVDEEQKIKLKTPRFGELEVPRENVIHMPGGVLGFPSCKDYILVPHKENSPFLWYQSLDDPALVFVVINPLIFKPDYDVPISPALMESLGAEKIEELELLAIVTVPKDRPQDMTANLLGPIVIDPVKRLAKQIVLDPERYSTKTPILPQKK